MSVFRDESGRRGAAVRLASVMAGVAALAAAGTFLVSVFPAPWTRRGEVLPEPAPRAKAGALPPGHPLEGRAREAAYHREEGRLRSLLQQAQAAQSKRRAASSAAPVLAGCVVYGDPASLRSLQQHADQLTHVMPEWIRLQPGGDFAVEEDARVLQAAQRLEVVPTVSNYGPGGFSAQLAQAVLATDALRQDAARKLARICEERGYAGVNVDLEDLGAQGFQKLALFVEALWGEMHPRGFLVTVDVPADPKEVPVERLAASSDFLVLMAYDEHSADDNPGPIATPESVARSAGEYLRRAPAEKLVLAIGAYGYDWPLDADGDTARPAEELSYAQALVLARENEVPIEWDAQARGPFFEYDDDEAREKHAVRFLDAPAEAAQLEAVAALHLRGTALWRLGAEDPKLFELFTRPPAPRAFDPGGARQRLDGLIANDPDDVETEGSGELISLKAAPQPGRREVTWSAAGGVERAAYLQYPSGWILERKGGKPRGRVTLTFDDGPDPAWTPRILDVLAQRGVHAAFFVVGGNAQSHPELVRREFAEGHTVGNHTFTHPDLARVSPLRMEVELNVTEKLLEWITGRHPRLFRPPYHSDQSLDEAPNAQVIARASAMGYLTLGHDIDPEDFSLRDPQEIARRVLAKARDGSVILLHDGGGNRQATLDALPLILDGLSQQGIQVVGPEDAVGLPRDQLLPAAPRAAIPSLISGADTLVFGVLGGIARLLGPAFGFALALLGLRAVILAVCAPVQARPVRRDGVGRGSRVQRGAGDRAHGGDAARAGAARPGGGLRRRRLQGPHAGRAAREVRPEPARAHPRQAERWEVVGAEPGLLRGPRRGGGRAGQRHALRHRYRGPSHGPVLRRARRRGGREREGRQPREPPHPLAGARVRDRKSTRLNSSHGSISYAVFCLKKKNESERAALILKNRKYSINIFFAVLSSMKSAHVASLYTSVPPNYYGFTFFFFNDTATTEIYTLSLHDALPI